MSRNYTLHAYDYEPALNDKMVDFASSVTNNATSFAEKISGTPMSHKTNPEIPPSFAHAFAKAASDSIDLVSPQEPFGICL